MKRSKKNKHKEEKKERKKIHRERNTNRGEEEKKYLADTGIQIKFYPTRSLERFLQLMKKERVR